MIIWSIVWGAVLGWLWPGHGDEGAFVGAFLGFFAGFSLRWAVRSEIEAARKKALPSVVPASRQAPPLPPLPPPPRNHPTMARASRISPATSR